MGINKKGYFHSSSRVDTLSVLVLPRLYVDQAFNKLAYQNALSVVDQSAIAEILQVGLVVAYEKNLGSRPRPRG